MLAIIRRHMYRLIYRAMIKSLRPTLCVYVVVGLGNIQNQKLPPPPLPGYKLKFILRGQPARWFYIQMSRDTASPETIPISSTDYNARVQ